MSVEFKVKPGQTPVSTLMVFAESTNIEELTNAQTRSAVVVFARNHGLPDALGIGGIPSPYPIDQEGKCDEDLIRGRRPFAKFQAEYTVNARV